MTGSAKDPSPADLWAQIDPTLDDVRAAVKGALGDDAVIVLIVASRATGRHYMARHSIGDADTIRLLQARCRALMDGRAPTGTTLQ